MDRYFTGKFEYSIDAKGRIAVPAKFRELLDKNEKTNFHIIRVPKYRLRILPENEWIKKAQIYANLPETEEFHEYAISFYSSQSDSELDSQGRITIPKVQLEKIKHKSKGSKLILLGMGKYFEAFFAENENLQINDDKNEKIFADNYYEIEKKIGKFEEK